MESSTAPLIPASICWIDCETCASPERDVTQVGAYRHTEECRVLIVAYAIDGGDVRTWAVADRERLTWADAPEDLRAFAARAAAGEPVKFVAWNAGFDRLALTDGIDGAPFFEVEWFLCAMVRATRANLPATLLLSSRQVGGVEKQTAGKALIRMFSTGDKAPGDAPDHWAAFVGYAADDVAAMRDVWAATPHLRLCDWQDYWASERINDQGLPVDLAFARAASQLAERAYAETNTLIEEKTAGRVTKVTQSVRLIGWCLRIIAEHLPDAEPMIATGEGEDDNDDEEPDEDAATRAVGAYSLGRRRVERVLALIQTMLDRGDDPHPQVIALRDVLEAKLWGGAAGARKYAKIVAMAQPDGPRRGWLPGGYVFCGASATGRFASRGVQVHNLPRVTLKTLDDEADAIRLISERGAAAYDAVAKTFGEPGKMLSALLRPTICAPAGRLLVWGDWSAIEARITPWLAWDFGGDAVVQVFEQNDLDKTAPDIYRVQAGDILGKPPTEVTSAERQSHGKVPVLSLGFGGGPGALHNMALNYGVAFDDAEAREIVRRWRERNAWAPTFWRAVWEAALRAMSNPETPYRAGRLTYAYLPRLLGGTLVCVLPDGFPLYYPGVRMRVRTMKDGTTKEQLSYLKQGRVSWLWHGTLVENAVQAVAAVLLRETLTYLDDLRREAQTSLVLVGHTHDEIVGLAPEADAEREAATLRGVMRARPMWAPDLPLAASVSTGEWYTKIGD
jgi:DNA polymerase